MADGFKYLIRDVDRHGNIRLYVQRPRCSKVRIKAAFGTDAFLAEYGEALAQSLPRATAARTAAEPIRGSLRWLITGYYQSAAYRTLDARTRNVRRLILDGICTTADSKGVLRGDKPYKRLEPRHVLSWRDARLDAPEAGNAIVKALRQVFKWATDPAVDLASSNPAAQVGYLDPLNPDGFHTWTVDEIRQFEARHPSGTKARLALAIFLFTGLRGSDARRLGKQMRAPAIDGSPVFKLVEWKGRGRKRTRKVREVPILPDLQRELDQVPAGQLTYLVTEFGKMFSAKGIGNWFRKRCDEAELPHCTAHGLRKGGATIAAERGATAHQLKSIYGWATLKQASRYTEQADANRIARESQHLVTPTSADDDVRANENGTQSLPLSRKASLPPR